MSNESNTGAWREAFDCVDTLLSRPENDRAQYLSELAQSRPDLHSRVQALLAADKQASQVGFMSLPAVSDSVGGILKADAQLGPYRMVRELGKGGMGEVWLARRDDGLYQGEVAVKTLHPYFGGGAMRDRFLREAQLLGRLAHPNIARLLDAGVADGVVYLVLEYVRGEPIDAWCDARSYSIHERLKLFLSVCAAVSHAHAQLVVHRDIKPSNILIADSGGAKLLDFGVAKLVENDSAGAVSELTRLGGRVFTPEFAAPEQILGEPVTVATDVYALGVLMYALLSGRRPYTAASTRELERLVLDADPSPLRQIAANDLERIASARATSPAKLTRELSGDLAVIVAKALRKKPADRYASVSALADDVERYLARRPVNARAGSRAYRLSRFVQRHRVGVAATVGVAMAAAVGVAGIVWQANEARAQARIARVEAQKANAVKEFLLGIFNTNAANHPDGVRARQTTAEQLLAIGSNNILQKSDLDPAVRIELMATLGDLNSSVEQFDQVAALLAQRQREVAERFGDKHELMAAVLVDLSQLQQRREQYADARRSAERAIEILTALGDNRSVLRGRAEAKLAEVLYLTEDLGSTLAVQQFERAVAIFERHPRARERIDALLGSAAALETLQRFDEAIAVNQRAIDAANDIVGAQSVEAASAHQQLARVYFFVGRFDEAQSHIDRSIAAFTRAVGEDHGLTGSALLDAARLALRRGRDRDAAAKVDRALAARIRTEGPDDIWVQDMRYTLALALFTIGDWGRAERLIDEALAVLAKTPRREVQTPLLHLRSALNRERGRFEAALADLDLAGRIGREPTPFPGYDDDTGLLLRGETLVAANRMAQAREVLTGLDESLRKQEVNLLSKINARTQLALAATEIAAGQADAAHGRVHGLVQALQSSPRRAELWEIESQALEQQSHASRALGKHEAACSHYRHAIALREANVLASDPKLSRLKRHSSACRTASSASSAR